MPITADLIKLIITDQKEEASLLQGYILRNSMDKLFTLAQNKEIIVITGVRRCGKSALLQKFRESAKEADYYLNFEDDRLANFTVDDFQTLYEVFIELFGVQNTFYFDEIQNIKGWELFIRRLYNQGNKIYITGSNANLFSEELGTRLTGRYISLPVYPISFSELLANQMPTVINKENFSTKEIGLIKKVFNEYKMIGGIPEYIKHKQTDYLHTLYESIIYRDIVARYQLPQAETIKKLVFYLASNCSKEVTYNALRKLLGIGSITTVSDYCGYLQNSFLCFFVHRYSDSIRVQMQSPKKVYFVDHVLAKTVGFRISEDIGRMLENIVFIELKRRNEEVFYYKEKKECDFIVRSRTKTLAAIQVCLELAEPQTRAREIDGLIEAMEQFSLQEGYIITSSETEVIHIENNGKAYMINVMPVWKWLLNTPS